MGRNIKKIELASTIKNLYLVEKFVEEICDEYNIYNSYFGNIMITLTEAVKNAIVHGNQDNINKFVTVEFESGVFGLRFRIEDQGNGFNHNQIPDPTDLSDDSFENAGKGIFLIKSLSDEVNFIENGKIIEVTFKISSINQEMLFERTQQLKSYYLGKVEERISKP
jgi:serine/threonine-protein kinase RsbW